MKTLVKIVNIIGNSIILNIIFVTMSAFSLLFCMGTSLSALYATFLDLETDNTGYYIRNYFKHFKNNFKQTLPFNVAFILLSGAAYLNFLMINTIENLNVKLILFAILGLIFFEISLIYSFVYPVIAKFDCKNYEVIYLSFIFAHKYIYISILFLVLSVASLLLVLYVSFAFVFIIFGFTAYIEALILKRLWRKYKYEIS